MDESAWKKIQKLRQSYLNANGDLPDYWQDDELLKAYDETLAMRIRWKWRAVLDALPLPLTDLPNIIVDWGCGTGGATREVLSQASQPEHFKKVIFMDRSSRAVKFATRKTSEEFPFIKYGIKVDDEPFLLLISHVFSELPEAELKKLLPLLHKASALIWVESGRPLESRRLSALREGLRSTHSFLAPCPHQGLCGMLVPEQLENWCHFKAPVPKEVHHSAFWRECSKQLGFDLRSLPVAYLFAVHHPLKTDNDGDHVRVLAGSRKLKGYTRYHGCKTSGVFEAEFMKRYSKQIYESLAEPGLHSIYRAKDLSPKEPDDANSL
ncbi:MAG: hypothetical protein H7249_15355 [Chitinophagaceae bacterium]|nr:hypothetical protein [Oligoflexus sp.]